MEFQCRVIVQRRCTSCCSSVENIPLQAERHSARRQKLFAFPPESAFTFRPECCSESQRNRVRLQSGIAFTFDRIPQIHNHYVINTHITFDVQPFNPEQRRPWFNDHSDGRRYQLLVADDPERGVLGYLRRERSASAVTSFTAASSAFICACHF